MSDEPPDTQREPMTVDQKLDHVISRLTQIEGVLLTISSALVEQDYTLRGHMRSHERDAERGENGKHDG